MRITSTRQIERLVRPGRYQAGDKLYLQVAASGAKSWLLRYQLGGRRHDMGLGRFPERTLAMAEAEAAAIRRQLAEGLDPLAARTAARAAAASETRVSGATFDAVAAQCIDAHRAGWKNPKSGPQWQSSLATYASPTIGAKPVCAITTDDVLNILTPIWTTKNVTATRVRQRIEAVLDYARVRGFRPEGENVARLRGHIAVLLPRSSTVHAVRHHAALDIDRLPAVMATLAKANGTAALAVRFVALTACRASEAAKASWAEIDAKAAVWTIPASRTKTRKLHRVPLSPAALAVLEEARGNARLLFPSPAGPPDDEPGPLSLTSLMKALRIASADRSTVHGLRSTFRDWCGERDGCPDELAEAALAHVRGGETQQAYARGDLFERRRALLARWAHFATGGAP